MVTILEDWVMANQNTPNAKKVLEALKKAWQVLQKEGVHLFPEGENRCQRCGRTKEGAKGVRCEGSSHKGETEGGGRTFRRLNNLF